MARRLLLLALLPPLTLAGGDDLSVSAIDASGCIVPDSESIKVDQGLSSRQVLEFGFSYYQSYRVFIWGPRKYFGRGCRHYSTVAMTFPSVLPPLDGHLAKGEIANTASNSVTNVAIQLLTGDGVNPVDLSKAPTAGDITLDTYSATNKLNFFARMITAGGSISQGTVGTTVIYNQKHFWYGPQADIYFRY